MTKILSVIAILLMGLHIIKPLGLPGLSRRRDFWKIAVAMVAAILLTALFREGWERAIFPSA